MGTIGCIQLHMNFLRQKILKNSSVAQGYGDLPLLALCSDACKGLKNAMNNVFPYAEKGSVSGI
jgi:hypothetical protein